jgi:hypothetical protein
MQVVWQRDYNQQQFFNPFSRRYIISRGNYWEFIKYVNMKKCCWKNIDKAIRKGRAKYECIKCGRDVSLLWFLFQKTTSFDVKLPKNFGKLK